MPFERAGYNTRSRDTGIRAFTLNVHAGGYFRAAALRRCRGGDFIWQGRRPGGSKFRSWGDFCRFRNAYELDAALRRGLSEAANTPGADQDTPYTPWMLERLASRVPNT